MAQHPQLEGFRGAGLSVPLPVPSDDQLVNKDDFMAPLTSQFGFEGGGDLPGEGGDIIGLVLDRHDHGYAKRHERSAPVFRPLHGAVGGALYRRAPLPNRRMTEPQTGSQTDSKTGPDVAVPAPPRLLTRLARHGYGVLALVCVLLWLPGVLRLPALDRDESRFAEASRQMLDSGNYVDIRFGQVPRYKKPVGIYWLQAAATAAAGPLNADQRDHTRYLDLLPFPSLLGGISGGVVDLLVRPRCSAPKRGWLPGC